MALATASSERSVGKSAPTMADVAKLAGVSAMTVSRALRQDGAVSQKTRERVLEVIDEIGYVPDQAAGALSSGHSGLVAVIVPTLTNPLYGLIARGLNDTLTPQGLQLFLGFSDYNATREEQMLEAMLRRRPEAVAVAGVDHTSKTERMLTNAAIPVVEFFDKPTTPIQHVVSIDHHAAGYAIAHHLASRERRNIVVLAHRDGVDGRGDRRTSGVIEALSELGLPPPTVLRGGGPLAPLAQGVRGVIEVLKSHPVADAIICMNDYAAVGAIGELRRRGVNVPERMAVTGFGDSELSQHVEPTVTTIGFNAVSIGVEIGKLMLATLDAVRVKREIPPFRLALDFQVMARGSA